jgi:hypothetical protein
LKGKFLIEKSFQISLFFSEKKILENFKGGTTKGFYKMKNLMCFEFNNYAGEKATTKSQRK